MNFQNDYNEFVKTSPMPDGFWSHRAQQGMQAFLDKGIPTRKMEDWRYSTLQFLKEATFETSNLKSAKLTEDQLTWVRSKLDSKFYDVVLVNGRYMPGLSYQGQEFKIQTLVEMMNTNPAAAQIQSLHQLDKKEDTFEQLAQAFTEFGVYLEIFKNMSLLKPIRLLQISTGNNQSVCVQNFVEVRSGSKVQLLEEYISLEGMGFDNTLTQIYVEPSANLSHCRLQALATSFYQVAKCRVYLKESSQLQSLYVSTGGQYTRLNLEVYMLGEGATAQVNGAIFVDGGRMSEAYTLIDHVVGHCTTTQNYKSILADKAKTTFNGIVKIRENAQKASSDQINKNLLLSKTAEANSKPELQIFADDVKANHGSTIGALNPEEVFYLQSRAIKKETAVSLLSRGFLTEVIYMVEHQQLQQYLMDKLLQAFASLKGES